LVLFLHPFFRVRRFLVKNASSKPEAGATDDSDGFFLGDDYVRAVRFFKKKTQA